MKKRMLIFVVAAVLVMLTACGSGENLYKTETHAEYGVPEEDTELTTHGAMGDGEVSAVHEYKTDIVRYGEPTGAFSFRKDVEKTQTDYAEYYFETSISNHERETCIVATDRALACIDGILPEIEIVVLLPESYNGVSMSDNRLYISVPSEDFTEFLAEVLLTAYGGWGNYGLAYGYANYLCRESGLDYLETDGFQQMSSPALYDLNLLCFNEKFVSPEDVEAAKNNACCFVYEYLSAHTEEDFLKLLSASGTAEGIAGVNEVLEAFYKDNGVECVLTELRYQYSGVTLDYAAACEYACFYIEKDWHDRIWKLNPKVSENFLHEDYGEVREFFECNARQMGQYQELFDFGSYDNDLPVIFSNSAYRGESMDSFYQVENHTIYVSSVISLSHEYIHAVTYGRINFKSLWKREGFASYYECQYNEYAYDFWNNDYNNPPDDEIGTSLKKYIDWIDRPIDLKTDHWEMENLKVYAYGYTDPDLTYTSGASFVGYLISQYGEKAVIAYVCSDDEYNAEWGKSYGELVQDWIDYINENYSRYSRE